MSPKSQAVSEWSTDNLILKDPALRALAGVNVLDQHVASIRGAQHVGGGKPWHYYNNSYRW